MNANVIFEDDLAQHTISRLDSLTTSDDGIQQKNTSSIPVQIAIYDKGTKLVRKTNEDDYPISTIHIYSSPNVLKILDQVRFNDLDHVVLEEKTRTDFSFYRAVANV